VVSLVVVRLGLPDVESLDQLSGCVGVVWGFRSVTPIEPWRVEVRHEGPGCGPDTGQHLEAFTCDYAGHRMTVGTHDDEALLLRVGGSTPLLGAALPAWWQEAWGEPWEGEYGARGLDRGIEVRLPGLVAGESALLHFAIAWGPRGSDQNAAAWFATDTTPDRILAHANLSAVDVIT